MKKLELMERLAIIHVDMQRLRVHGNIRPVYVDGRLDHLEVVFRQKVEDAPLTVASMKVLEVQVPVTVLSSSGNTGYGGTDLTSRPKPA